jgi:hypothetical protein
MNICALSGILTHDPSNRAAAYLRLRLRLRLRTYYLDRLIYVV